MSKGGDGAKAEKAANSGAGMLGEQKAEHKH